MQRTSYARLLVLVGWLGGCVLAQQGALTDVTPKAPVVAIVGASVSKGFKDGPATGGSADNDTVPLDRVIKAWLQQCDAKVTNRADLTMFLRPLEIGQAQIDKAVKDKPDLVLAVDFLFWFGYGHVDRAHQDGERGARMERLEQGLAMLAALPCPVLVGDLPDMAGAARRMISPAQIPAPEILTALNERITGWAKAHANVRTFPLGATVSQMKTQGVDLELATGKVTVPPGGMLQTDRLHANRLGMAWLGLLVQRELVAGKVLVEAPQWTLDQFVVAAGAEVDLESLSGTAVGRDGK
ncbi:MAG: hypothetical protein IPK26_14375 [Planctomycetes bacterium]|nr:hypothetical protein [Planctomycetota bacterium]